MLNFDCDYLKDITGDFKDNELGISVIKSLNSSGLEGLISSIVKNVIEKTR